MCGRVSLGVCAAVCLFLSYDLLLLLLLLAPMGGLAKFAFIVKMFHFIYLLAPKAKNSNSLHTCVNTATSTALCPLPCLCLCLATSPLIGIVGAVYWSLGLLVFWLWIMTKLWVKVWDAGFCGSYS